MRLLNFLLLKKCLKLLRSFFGQLYFFENCRIQPKKFGIGPDLQTHFPKEFD